MQVFEIPVGIGGTTHVFRVVKFRFSLIAHVQFLLLLAQFLHQPFLEFLLPLGQLFLLTNPFSEVDYHIIQSVIFLLILFKIPRRLFTDFIEFQLCLF